MKTLVGNMDDKIRRARLEWIAMTLKDHLRKLPDVILRKAS